MTDLQLQPTNQAPDAALGMGEPAAPAALLVLAPDVRHEAPPLKVDLQLRRAAELLQAALPKALCGAELHEAGGVRGLASCDAHGLLEAARRLSGQLRAEPDLGFRLGLHATPQLSRLAAADWRSAQQVAMAVRPGGLGLSAEAVDLLQRAWSLPLRDLGLGQDLGGSGNDNGNNNGSLRVFTLEPDAAPARAADAGLHAPLAVLPPLFSGRDPRSQGVAELIADTLVVGLSRSALLRVLSRNSLRRLPSAPQAEDDAFQYLGAAHVLRGRASLGLNGVVFVQFELLAREHAGPVWAERVSLDIEELLYGESAALAGVVNDVHAALMSEMLQMSQWVAWQELENHQLLCAATQLMHRMSPAGFARSREMLDELVRRLPQAAEPHAWLARWQVGAASQGLVAPREAAQAARAACQEALTRDSQCALALTLEGYSRLMQGGALSESGPLHQKALRANANEALAWLWSALHQTYEGQSARAHEALGVALALSPLDPWRFIFEDVAAHVHLAGGQLDRALLHAQAALRLRAQHAPTLCNLAVIQALRGEQAAAREAMERLLKHWPGYSLARFRERYPGLRAPHAAAFLRGLELAGMPP